MLEYTYGFNAVYASIRRWLASLLIIAAPIPAILENIYDVPYAIIIATVGIMLMSVAVHVRRLEVQLFARATLWANLVWISLIVLIEVQTAYSGIISFWTVCIGTALLLLGSQNIQRAQPGDTFVPAAMRGTMIAVLVLAMADTMALSFWTVLAFESSSSGYASVFFACAASVMFVALYGLYRLRAWGFFLNLAANIAVAGGAWVAPNIPVMLAYCLTATAVGQLLAALPLLVGMARGGVDSTPDTGRSPWFGALAVLTLMGIVLCRGAIGHGLFR